MDPWPGYIRALTYPILFEARPVEGIERVIKTVVGTGKSGTRDEFLQAISEALASKEDLGQLFSDDHTDQTIREFLIELAAALRARSQPPN